MAFRVIAGDAQPDHSCISELRRLHLDEFVRLFGQILCDEMPQTATADSGYFSAENVAYARSQGIDIRIPTERWKHGEAPPPVRGRPPKDQTLRQEMTRRLRTERARTLYARRKVIVEPVFGQIKAARGIRAFLLRGLAKVRGEWSPIAMTHNLLKLWRASAAPA